MNIPSVAPLNSVTPANRQTSEKNSVPPTVTHKTKRGSVTTINDEDTALLMHWKDLTQTNKDIREEARIQELQDKLRNGELHSVKNDITGIADALLALTSVLNQNDDTEAAHHLTQADTVDTAPAR